MRRILLSDDGVERHWNESNEGFVRRVLDGLRRDGCQAVRRLRKDWRFSVSAITILALGIGANTAVFSILNTTLFRPHPFVHSERLVNLYQNEAKTGEPEGVSYPAFLDLRQETAVFSGVAASRLKEGRYQAVDAQGRPGAMRLGLLEYGSANFLEVLGLRPSLGRWFTAEEERFAEGVAVLGWTEWKRYFGGDPNVLGRTLIVGGVPIQVIGVGPVALQNSGDNSWIVTLWMPVSRMEGPGGAVSGGNSQWLERRDQLTLQVRARLRDGVTVQQAQAAMDVTGRRWAADYPDKDPQRGITVLATDEVHVHPRERRLKPVIATGLAIVGLVLAIACSNLSTLLLVRSGGRAAEISIRLALGATRWQLVRHLLMESFVLSLAGTAAGVALAHWGFRYLATADLPIILSMQLDYRVLGFAVAVAMLCGVAFGLTPALQSTRVDAAGALREGRASSKGALSLARGWFTMKNALVVGQVAASFLLLVGAVLAMRILTATQERSVGYQPDGLAILQTDPRYAGYDVPRARALLEDLRRRIAAMPGVERVCVTSGLPVEGQFDRALRLEGAPEKDSFQVEGRFAGPGYFATLGIPLLFGRAFEERDVPGGAETIVVSEAFARRFFSGADAVGKRFRFNDADSPPMEIVGVAGDARSIDLVVEAPRSFIYRSQAQAGVMPTTLVVRTARDETAMLGVLQQGMRRMRPELPVVGALTMKQRQSEELAPFRAAIAALGTLGGLGLLLAGVGLYAVVAYAVAQRTNELGIRIALGARSGDLTWLVVRDVTALVLAGIGIGAAVSWVAVAVLESSVAHILGVHPLAVAPVVVTIVVCAAAAACVSVRRAVRTDPIVAIRHQ